MSNRLASETSPYLLQHKDNPVDWYPWGPEAFAKAQSEDKPIFLSVGYSSCHWCHVMEHESFVDEEVAALLNEHFVSVKVDREERPDVDEAYMTAVQLASGRGGWPMSVFLTPDRRPFFAATYLPKQDHPQSPGFITTLTQIERVWKEERPRVEEIAAQYDEAIRASMTRESPTVEVSLDQELFDELVKALSMDFDEENGGFGQAPKFPPHTAIDFLLMYPARGFPPDDLCDAATDMAFATLRKMALGGIHDHIGGGFHRYSTDGHWLVPHFEKMLYDNALLLANYARANKESVYDPHDSKKIFYKASKGIVEWLKREMTTADGLFCSALDADSEGEEGKYYVWSAQEIDEVLGERSQAFKDAFQIRPEGNFRDEATGHVTGYNIPHLLGDMGDEFVPELELLRVRREERVKPGLDHKVLISWNGLAIHALLEFGELEMAERAIEAILRYEKELGYLPHQIVDGKPSGEGFLEDYAYFILGIFSSGEYSEDLFRLIETMVEKFYDEERGGFFSTSDRHEDLFGRTKPVFDQPLPSPNAVAIRSFFATQDGSRIEQSLGAFLGWMARAPTATEALHHVGMDFFHNVEPFLEHQREWERTHVRVGLSSNRLDSTNGKAQGALILNIPEGHYIQSVKVEIDPPFALEIFYPSERYEGNVEIPFRVLGQEGGVELTVTYQACTETECQPAENQTLYAEVRPT